MMIAPRRAPLEKPSIYGSVALTQGGMEVADGLC